MCGVVSGASPNFQPIGRPCGSAGSCRSACDMPLAKQAILDASRRQPQERRAVVREQHVEEDAVARRRDAGRPRHGAADLARMPRVRRRGDERRQLAQPESCSRRLHRVDAKSDQVKV